MTQPIKQSEPTRIWHRPISQLYRSDIRIEDVEKIYLGNSGCRCGCGGIYLYANQPETRREFEHQFQEFLRKTSRDYYSPCDIYSGDCGNNEQYFEICVEKGNDSSARYGRTPDRVVCLYTRKLDWKQGALD